MGVNYMDENDFMVKTQKSNIWWRKSTSKRECECEIVME